MNQTEYSIFYFEKDNGDCPVEEFLDSLNDKMAAKVYSQLELLEESGPALREPYSKHLEDGIFELRVKFSSNITRILYFFYVGKKIILTNGFVKKTQKTPPKEIELAHKYRKIFLNREESK